MLKNQNIYKEQETIFHWTECHYYYKVVKYFYLKESLEEYSVFC